MTSDIDNKATSGAASGGEVAGFWRRTVAFGIDCLVLGLIGSTLAFLFFDQLAKIGLWGRLIGFLIGVGYFGFMEGFAGRCQSLGKRVLKIKVVRRDANGVRALTFAQASARYAVIAIPLVLGGIGFVDLPVLNSLTMAWLSTANRLVVFLWSTASLYLLAFNRPCRQSLHDLAVSSLVIRDSASEARVTPVRTLHWVVLGAVAGLVIIVSPFLNRYVASKLTDMYAIQRATLSIPGVRQCSITANSSWHVGTGDKARRTAMIAVVTNAPVLLTERGMLEIAKAAFAASPILASQDAVTIVSARAVDLGIATWRTQYAESFPGSEWVAKIGSGAPRTVQ
ncbi:RDD family protein [Paraburkholderia adhaesiva]|uniref:RDD family protein n=1 Tax=Paraburkholderia adhaesiva TaxID=2883244 RepID=UPI001F457F2A|nr:RDD family protein [Paraburkholderia adhaesiva]